MQVTTNFKLKSIAPEQLFMLSVLIVNGGNYLYNLLLGRLLGPSQFADAAVLITFLLVLSFVAMTFQLATAKFSVVLQSNVLQNFFSKVYKYATIIGISFGYKIGVATIGLYLIEGIAGLPVFSNSPERGIGLAYFTGPTMGYLIGFLSACFLASFVKETPTKYPVVIA